MLDGKTICSALILKMGKKQTLSRKQKHESDFLVERNLPLVSADQVSRISKSMFPDSKITSKSKCVDTNSTHISTGSAAKHIVIDLKDVLGESYWYNLAANGRSDKGEKCLLVFYQTYWS